LPFELEENQKVGKADIFGLIPNDEEKTMLLFPMDNEKNNIVLTKKTAEILIEMLTHQIRKW